MNDYRVDPLNMRIKELWDKKQLVKLAYIADKIKPIILNIF